MTTVGTATLDDITRLRGLVEKELEGCQNLQAAAQRFSELLFEELVDSAVLLRVFATASFTQLPEMERGFAVRLSQERGFEAELRPSTTVVTLLGTRGRRASWNERRLSKRHLAIPLVRTSFIKTIPMVSRLMSEMGTGVAWVEKQHNNIVVKTMGKMASVLHVDDAREATTADGFKVVPDQDFVSANGVHTVVGLAGAYLNGTVVAVIVFTDERAPAERVNKFMPLINAYKVATMKNVMAGRIFA
ncbi:MAG TPA: hypothetical protein VLK65_21655 [Vicinamibacteria bacterium]|nr:hypothetical protein [Vicinamibacteria bacterium]